MNQINPQQQVAKTQQTQGKTPVKQSDAVKADQVKLANIQNLFANVVANAPKEIHTGRAILEAA